MSIGRLEFLRHKDDKTREELKELEFLRELFAEQELNDFIMDDIEHRRSIYLENPPKYINGNDLPLTGNQVRLNDGSIFDPDDVADF